MTINSGFSNQQCEESKCGVILNWGHTCGKVQCGTSKNHTTDAFFMLIFESEGKWKGKINILVPFEGWSDGDPDRQPELPGAKKCNPRLHLAGGHGGLGNTSDPLRSPPWRKCCPGGDGEWGDATTSPGPSLILLKQSLEKTDKHMDSQELSSSEVRPLPSSR